MMTLLTKFCLVSLLVLILPGCSMFARDCAKLAADPAAYRACQAGQGDAQAQYELGLAAYDARDYATARRWLKLAATPSSGRTPIYMPPVGGQTYGTVMMMDTGSASAGHRGAQLLLAEIYAAGLGGAPDPELAAHYRTLATRGQLP
ncbi:sel1 repeat family protein [Paremcibacter congregatus]|nr:sel1 repeat family protein [Paremcibacter congregatus]QDE26296.1 sel1 repeat family protein [Paremcibacter congregatus]